jgi:hypothetical protein
MAIDITVVVLSGEGKELFSVSHPDKVAALISLNKGDIITYQTGMYYSGRTIARKEFEIPTNTYTIRLTS